MKSYWSFLPEVAQKYEATDANIEMLAGKVIKGGSGVWGQVPMTPHDSLSLDNAKVMVKYILALKNAK
jgi:cytochrome c